MEKQVKQQALKLGESLAPGLIQYENHLRKKSLAKEKLIKTAAMIISRH